MAITVASQLMVEILDFPRWILRHLGTQEAQKSRRWLSKTQRGKGVSLWLMANPSAGL